MKTNRQIAKRCFVCRRKDTLIEVRADGQRAMQCMNCSWLDPESIQNVEDQNIAGDEQGVL